jgi:hypothetical protein
VLQTGASILFAPEPWPAVAMFIFFCLFRLFGQYRQSMAISPGRKKKEKFIFFVCPLSEKEDWAGPADDIDQVPMLCDI